LRDAIVSRIRGADVSIFHRFYRPPYGGGNQFLLALRGEFERRGLLVENNTISNTTRACLFNSFNFDFDRLRRLRREGCRMIHRVDGPIGGYRGRDDGTDRRIHAINQELADATVFQSQYSLDAHHALGLKFNRSVAIMNAVDPGIFHPYDGRPEVLGRKTRLISSSWSSNSNKGAATYQWLDKHLDWQRFDYTFVGRSETVFERIRVIPPVDSDKLADLLRQHDIYIAASLHDPCSNALLEALTCGLPAIYAQSGGHKEIVGEAGFGFSTPESVPALLDRLIREYEDRCRLISIPTLENATNQYLSVMGLVRDASAMA
jgi:glycosyltransferase involved in cell wall biosynthesis